MRLIVLDCETTGLDPAVDVVLEVAAALYDVGSRSMLWCYSSLVHQTAPNPAVEVNGITDEMRAAWAHVASINPFAPMIAASGAADVLAAHNAPFDRSFIERVPCRIELPWVCTREDIAYAKARGSRSLGHLCADYGIPIANRHRAIGDVLLLCELLKQVPDLDAQIALALKPRGLFNAVTSYDDRELARAAGFQWVPAVRAWQKTLPLDTPIGATEARPFRIELVREVPR